MAAASGGAPPSETAARKAALRRVVLARRDGIPAERRAELSAVIFGVVEALDALRGARTVLAYCSFGSEPVTDPFLRAVLGRGQALVLPKVRREPRRLDLYRVADPARDLRPGVWGIREPDPAACAAVAPGAVDFALVPGVAFDARGGRIGYGGGYYDRLIRDLPAGTPLVAAAFEVQIVNAIPVEPHDRPLDRIVTERRVLGPGPR